MGNSLNKMQVMNLRNKSGVSVAKGDCVIIDNTTQESFTVTGSTALANSLIGVVIDQAGISNNGNGIICFSGYVPQVNLTAFGNYKDAIGLSSTAKQAASHALMIPGDFGQLLGTGTTPSAYIWGFPIQANTGSGGGGSWIADYQIAYYTGTSDINLGLTGTSNVYVDVDASNAKISFTPNAAGKYKVTFTFSHFLFPNAAAAYIDTFFRITDGTTTTQGVESYARTTASGQDRTNTISLSYIFNWSDTSARTIKLQKNQTVNSTISANYIGASNGGSLIMEVFRIGS